LGSGFSGLTAYPTTLVQPPAVDPLPTEFGSNVLDSEFDDNILDTLVPNLVPNLNKLKLLSHEV
jgi:hypothetical protein